MKPKPTMPTVFPSNSTKEKFERSDHALASRVAPSPQTNLLATAKSSITLCSETGTRPIPRWLTTRIPRSVAAGMSILSVPKPEVETTTKSLPASRISAVTRSGVRTHNAFAPCKTCLSSSASELSTTTTSAPPFSSRSCPILLYIGRHRTTFGLLISDSLYQPNDHRKEKLPRLATHRHHVSVFQ